MERMRFALICLATLPMFACQTPALDPAPPSASFLLAESALPDYEDRLDHAGLIGDSSRAAYGRGQVTYRTTCHSCHGDAATPGSIPSSRRFWSEAFKNGSDPFSQYQTLTRGFGQMPPQVRLTPREKYDVIHFIREEFLKEANPGQHFAITDDWMATLPQGDTLGPDPTPYRPWADMDYGDFLIHTYELANSGDPPRGISGGPSPLPDEDFRDVNFSYKGIAVRLDQGDGGIAAGNAFVLFDHDLLRFTGFWTGEGFMDYEYVLLNGRHNTFPRTVGKIEIENPITPGWANPETGDFEDPRFVAVDGRPFGPLPREWAHYKGLYHHGDRVVIKYTVGDAEVLETYDLERGQPVPVISRTLNISASSTELRMRVAPSQVAVHLVGRDVELIEEDGFHVMVVPAGTGVAVKLWMSGGEGVALQEVVSQGGPPEDLDQYTHGGPIHYPEVLTTPVVQGEGDGAYVTDVLTLPLENPWKSRMRPTGIDFFDGGRGAVVSTMDGEVWQVDGILSDQGNWLTKLLGSERQQEPSSITWKRIATGLFQPLGIRYHEGDIYVGCRDQIVILRDLNGDGETDFYESFNSDHQVTEHFHEFAMGLQTDDVGNFYYAKSARHARTPLVPQHGTLMRVSPDGSTSDIIANGFRAANGVAINADGSFIVTDQEGHWNPMNRVNWVEEGGFYGNMYGYGAPPDSSDEAMIPPLVWIDQKYDRSPAELMWAESDRWGPLSGHLLSLSYGTGKVFVVMPQTIEGTRQGGIVEMPIPHFPTGIMRGRMNPNDGQLYAVGMSAWATNQNLQVGGLYRVRYTGESLHLPVELKALTSGIELTFAAPLERSAAEDPSRYTIKTWELERTRNYGSDRLDTRELTIDRVDLSDDRKTVMLHMPDIQPTWIMEILFSLKGDDGKAFEGAVQNTIYDLETVSDGQ